MMKYQTTLSGVEILQEGVGDVEEGSDLFGDNLNLFAIKNLSRPTGPTFHPIFSITSYLKKIQVILVVASSKWWCFSVMVMLFMSILAFHGPWNCAGPAQSHPHDAKTTTQTGQAQPNST